MKRNVLRTMLAAGFALAALVGAHAQNFPLRPVTLIVPWPAGGTTDVGMRALASAAERHLGQSIVVENRPGGSGTLGPGQRPQNPTATPSRRFRSPSSVFPS